MREAKEEIGVEAELEKPFYTGEFQKDDTLYMWHGYLASTEDEPEIQEERFSEKRWFDAEDLDEENIAPNLEMIEPALRRLLRSGEEGS